MRLSGFVVLTGLVLCLGCGGGGGSTTMTGEPVTLAFGDLGGVPAAYEADISVTTAEGARNWISSFDFTMKVEEMAADGSISRRFDFNKFAITNYSGSTPEPDPNAPGFSGEFLIMKQDADGKILDWRGLDGIRGSVPGWPRLKGMLVYIMYLMTQPPPSDPVNVGSTWQDTFETPLSIAGNQVAMKGEISYAVDGFGQKAGRDCIKIETKNKITGVGDRLVGEKQEPSFEHEGEGKGTIWWDYTDGVVVEFDWDSSANQTFRRERAGVTDVTTDYSSVDTEIKIKMK